MEQTMQVGEMNERVTEFRQKVLKLRNAIAEVIVGHDDIVTGVMIALLSGGHVLLEGVPGLGKTMLVRTLAETIDLTFSRLQFTPDLMPADILGTNGNTLGSTLNLPNDFMVQVISQVGNYGEIFDRNLGPDTIFGLARGVNALWTDGGLMYSPPFR